MWKDENNNSFALLSNEVGFSTYMENDRLKGGRTPEVRMPPLTLN